MLFAMWLIILAIIQLIRTGNVQGIDSQLSIYFDEGQINAILHKLQIVVLMNQNIQVKLDALNMSNYQLFAELKMSIDANDICKAEQKQCDCNATSADLAKSTTAAGHTNASVDSKIDVISKTAMPPVIPNFCQIGQQGLQLIQIPNSNLSPFYVNCIQGLQQDDGPWLLIQRRRDGNIDFYRDWSDYQHGFGNLEGDFFMGLNKLHALTQSALYELWIKIVDSLGEARWAKYSSFAIGDESQSYALNILGSFTGTAGDSLTYHAGQKFTTKDRDNDDAGFNCAVRYDGAWWFKECRQSNLNGKYLNDPNDVTGKGIAWDTWNNHNLLKYVHMAIRPVNMAK